jgi:hypothetical protein
LNNVDNNDNDNQLMSFVGGRLLCNFVYLNCPTDRGNDDGRFGQFPKTNGMMGFLTKCEISVVIERSRSINPFSSDSSGS